MIVPAKFHLLQINNIPGSPSTQTIRQRLHCLTFTLSPDQVTQILHRSQSKGQAMIPPLTWQHMSCGQASGPSSCTVSGVSFCSSTPGGISLFLDTRTPQTSSSVWLSLRCLGPGFWTLPWSTGTGGWGKKSDSYRKNYFSFLVLLLCDQMCIQVFDCYHDTQQKILTLQKLRRKMRQGCLSFPMPLEIIFIQKKMLSKHDPFHNGTGCRRRTEYAFLAKPAGVSLWCPSWQTLYLISGEKQCHAV